MKLIHKKSPNFNERKNNADINMLIIHYTGMKTAEEALERMCDEKAQVSAHYMIDEKGDVFCLVDEKKRAWHAGVSFWRGVTDINSHSIGIELVNKGHEFGYHEFSKEQMQSLIMLSKDILARNPLIEARNIVGHADVAPDRKQDPGELFNWELLYKNGIGVFPNKKRISSLKTDDIEKMFLEYGYKEFSEEAVIAFARHFCPEYLITKDIKIINKTISSLIESITK